MLPLEIFYNLTGGEVKARWEWEEEDGGVNRELHSKSDKCGMSQKKNEQHPCNNLVLVTQSDLHSGVGSTDSWGFSVPEGQATDFLKRSVPKSPVYTGFCGKSRITPVFL